ncbi:MAG: diphthine synthase [Infirmifilum sp.]
MFIIGGLGLYGLRDVSVGLLSELKTVDQVFIEEYTSLAPDFSKSEFEKMIGKPVVTLRRKDLENGVLGRILEESRDKKIALLTYGNPLVATTHSYIISEAYRRGIQVKIYPAPSVFDGVICSTGLHVYKFGPIATLVYPEEKLKFYPYSTYKIIGENMKRGLHTLLLLDIKTEENKFMSIPEAAEVLLRLEEVFQEKIISSETLIIGVSRALSPTEEIFVGSITSALGIQKSPPPHSIVIPGLLHDTEIDFLEYKLHLDRRVLVAWNRYVEKKLQNT